MATVKHVEHEDGSHSIGADVDGKYVPFVSVGAAHVASCQHSDYYNPPKETGGKGKGGDQ